MIKRTINENLVKALFPKRPVKANKGTFGNVLIVGGSDSYPGAPHLSALAAARVGAGLITIASIPSVRIFTAKKNLEFTYSVLKEDEGFISGKSFETIKDKLSNYDTLLVGPGLGNSKGTKQFLNELLEYFSEVKKLPKIIFDADALDILSELNIWLDFATLPAVLTPHPGEMAKLTGLSVKEIQSDREKIALDFAEKTNKVVILKGANTLIAGPAGEIFQNPFANPILATAGTGDVLSGIIAGFLAQGLSLFNASIAAVYLHAKTAEKISKDLDDSGMIASDLISKLPVIIHDLKSSH